MQSEASIDPRLALTGDLNPAQQQAVTTDAQPLAILAGAGSGKTRVLTRRIAYRLTTGSALPQHVLALTFTRRAAGELASRLSALGVRDRVATGTFHAIAYAQLRRLWADANRRPPALLEHKVRLLGPLLSRTSGDPIQPADVAAEIEWAKARLVGPAGYEAAAASAGRRPPLAPSELANLYERYEHEKSKRMLVDFDDLVLLCGQALQGDRQFTATQRWRFRHLFVDEFQDVNPAQLRLLDGWRGDRSDLCVVGDPDQAIYGWNGADARPLIDFARRFPGASMVRLDQNYRSSPQILAVANAVLDRPASQLVANRPDGPVPVLRQYGTDAEEARAVAGELRRRRGQMPWAHLAVLARTHGQLVMMEQALRTANIPVHVRGSVAFLERPEIRDALADLRRRPPGSLLSACLADIRELGREAGAAIDGPAAERRDALDTLARLISEQLAIDPAVAVSTFIGWLAGALRADPADTQRDAVELATFHAAKGLEWPVVFLVGLEQGLVPISHASGPAQRAEERRLLYVAATRAERELHCSWAERRTFGSRTSARSASPYLEAIQATLSSLASGNDGADWRRHLQQSRTRVRPKGPPKAGGRADPVTLTALKSWRANAARGAGVPAHIVLPDSTLAALAEAKPSDHGALLALPGMGPVKLERYGDALLALLAPHREATSA